MNLHFMNAKLLSVFESYKFIIQAALLRAYIMRYFIMYFKIIIIFIIPKSLFFIANITNDMLEVDMHPKLVLIEKCSGTKFTYY
jgi:hypothetical protein